MLQPKPHSINFQSLAKDLIYVFEFPVSRPAYIPPALGRQVSFLFGKLIVLTKQQILYQMPC